MCVLQECLCHQVRHTLKGSKLGSYPPLTTHYTHHTVLSHQYSCVANCSSFSSIFDTLRIKGSVTILRTVVPGPAHNTHPHTHTYSHHVYTHSGALPVLTSLYYIYTHSLPARYFCAMSEAVPFSNRSTRARESSHVNRVGPAHTHTHAHAHTHTHMHTHTHSQKLHSLL